MTKHSCLKTHIYNEPQILYERKKSQHIFTLHIVSETSLVFSNDINYINYTYAELHINSYYNTTVWCFHWNTSDSSHVIKQVTHYNTSLL